jgi:MtN3 and saliva related transmembrane protein
MLATIIGSLAAALSVASFAPQALRIIRTRETKGLSVKTYLLTSLGFALWIVFGILKVEWPIIVPNVLCLIFALFILAMLVMPSAQKERVADALNPDAS